MRLLIILPVLILVGCMASSPGKVVLVPTGEVTMFSGGVKYCMSNPGDVLCADDDEF